MKLSSHLDAITKIFWDSWVKWRRDAGWRLGPDNPGALLNPYMVDSFEKLTPDGKQWFRAHAALVLHATEQVLAVPAQVEPKVLPRVPEPVESQVKVQKKPFFPSSKKVVIGATSSAQEKLKAWTDEVGEVEGGVLASTVSPVSVLQSTLLDALKILNRHDIEGAKFALARALRMASENPAPDYNLLKVLKVAAKNIENYRQGEDPKRTKKSVRTALGHLNTNLDFVFEALAPEPPTPKPSVAAPVSMAKARSRLPGSHGQPQRMRH